MTVSNKVRNHDDLAMDSWVGKWPAWLRWFLFFPAAVLGSITLSTLFLLVIVILNGAKEGELDRYWFEILQSALRGWLFVYTAAYIAPKYQKLIGISMLVLGAVLLTILMTLEVVFQIDGLGYSFFHALIMLAGSGVALYAIFDQL